MKTETKIAWFILLLAPALGELVSGSAPPTEFFHPIAFVLLVLLYGGGALLIREAKARWNLQWSVIFLAVAYGIFEEGTVIQSFFNVDHGDLNKLSGYGMYFGIQWPWMIMLTLFHATMSTLIPITISELLWPEYKNKPVLKKKGIIFASLGLLFFAALWMGVLIGQKTEVMYENYTPDNVLVIGSFLVCLLLVWLARKYGGSQILASKFRVLPPFVFGIAGFMFQAVNIFWGYGSGDNQLPGEVAILGQLIIVFLALLFTFSQILNRATTERHLLSLVSGSLLLWMVFVPIHVMANGMVDMALVGIVGLPLLILFRCKVLKKLSF